MTYYTQKTNCGGLNISDNVFNQIATECLKDLQTNDLKEVLFLKNGKKQTKVNTIIDKKNHIQVTAEIYLVSDSNADSVTSQIQKAIYDDIYDSTEISQVKVNVVVLGFLEKKANA